MVPARGSIPRGAHSMTSGPSSGRHRPSFSPALARVASRGHPRGDPKRSRAPSRLSARGRASPARRSDPRARARDPARRPNIPQADPRGDPKRLRASSPSGQSLAHARGLGGLGMWGERRAARYAALPLAERGLSVACWDPASHPSSSAATVRAEPPRATVAAIDPIRDHFEIVAIGTNGRTCADRHMREWAGFFRGSPRMVRLRRANQN
jgi:hypothetical protein